MQQVNARKKQEMELIVQIYIIRAYKAYIIDCRLSVESSARYMPLF